MMSKEERSRKCLERQVCFYQVFNHRAIHIIRINSRVSVGFQGTTITRYIERSKQRVWEIKERDIVVS